MPHMRSMVSILFRGLANPRQGLTGIWAADSGSILFRFTFFLFLTYLDSHSGPGFLLPLHPAFGMHCPSVASHALLQGCSVKLLGQNPGVNMLKCRFLDPTSDLLNLNIYSESWDLDVQHNIYKKSQNHKYLPNIQWENEIKNRKEWGFWIKYPYNLYFKNERRH